MVYFPFFFLLREYARHNLTIVSQFIFLIIILYLLIEFFFSLIFQEGPLPRNDRVRYEPLDVYPAPLHRC